MTEHPHFCDCEDCMNRGGGTKIADLTAPRKSAYRGKRDTRAYRARRRLAAYVKKVVLAREANTTQA